MITMILMAMMILDIVSRWVSEAVLIFLILSLSPRHPVFHLCLVVTLSSSFSRWCVPPLIFLSLFLPPFPNLSISSLLLPSVARNNLLNGHSLPLWFMTHEALISFEDESIVIDLHSLFSFERRALLSSLELRLLFDPTLSSFPPFLWPQLSKLGKFISVRGNYQLPQRSQKTASPAGTLA